MAQEGSACQEFGRREVLSDPDGLPHRIHRIEFQNIAAYGLVQRHRPERLSYVYDLHIKNVCESFQDRPNDLLIMNILQGDGWDVLCPFLGKPAPQSPFPNLGRGNETS